MQSFNRQWAQVGVPCLRIKKGVAAVSVWNSRGYIEYWRTGKDSQQTKQQMKDEQHCALIGPASI